MKGGLSQYCVASEISREKRVHLIARHRALLGSTDYGIAGPFLVRWNACHRSPAMNARVRAPRAAGAKYAHLMAYICTTLMRLQNTAQSQ